MNRPAPFPPPPSDPAPVSGAAAGDPSIRPKVLRRPAHFSGTPTHDPSAETFPITPPATAANPQAAALAWQDDGRFGLVLFALIASINIALILWLPHLHRARISPAPETFQPGVLREKSTEPSAPITFYAPPDPSQRQVQSFDLQRTDSANNPTGVTADVLAIPQVAPPIDDDVEAP